MGKVSLKWKMHDKNHFEATHDNYIVVVKPFGGLGPYWSIIKDGVEVDCAYYHLPATSELDAKVKSERALNKILSVNLLQQ